MTLDIHTPCRLLFANPPVAPDAEGVVGLLDAKYDPVPPWRELGTTKSGVKVVDEWLGDHQYEVDPITGTVKEMPSHWVVVEFSLHEAAPDLFSVDFEGEFSLAVLYRDAAGQVASAYWRRCRILPLRGEAIRMHVLGEGSDDR